MSLLLTDRMPVVNQLDGSYSRTASLQNISDLLSVTAGGVGGTGTTGTLTKWTDGAGALIGDSMVSESGSVLTVTGTLVVTGNTLTIRSVAYTFPSADGNADDVLSTDGAGALSWVAQTGGGGAVDSVFGRTGTVTAADNDYAFAQLSSIPTTVAGYGITDALVAGSTILLNGITYTLPASDGTDTQVLSTDGAGTLSWAAPGGGGTISGLTAGTIPKASNSTTIVDSIITESSTVLTITGSLIVTEGVNEIVHAFGSVTGAQSYDCAAYRFATLTLTGDVTLTFSNMFASGRATVVNYRETGDGASQVTVAGLTVTWPSGTPPVLGAGVKRDVSLISTDGSTALGYYSGSGAIDGSGTTGALAKFTASGTLGDSIITESGTVATITGTLVVTGTTLTIRSVAYTFPSADGAASSSLTTNGSGTLSWVKYVPLAGGTMTGALLFTDNSIDIGASGATRPRTIYVGTSVISPLLNNTGNTITLRGVTYTLPSADAAGVFHSNGSGTTSWSAIVNADVDAAAAIVDTKLAQITTASKVKAGAIITEVNAQTASYTAVLGDANKVVEISNAGANNFTIPLNASVAYPVGTFLTIVQTGAGATTVVATGGVTIRCRQTLVLKGQYSMASLYKRATDEWVLTGDLT